MGAQHCSLCAHGAFGRTGRGHRLRHQSKRQPPRAPAVLSPGLSRSGVGGQPTGTQSEYRPSRGLARPRGVPVSSRRVRRGPHRPDGVRTGCAASRRRSVTPNDASPGRTLRRVAGNEPQCVGQQPSGTPSSRWLRPPQAASHSEAPGRAGRSIRSRQRQSAGSPTIEHRRGSANTPSRHPETSQQVIGAGPNAL